jgi:probable phosphoglycerate mutase
MTKILLTRHGHVEGIRPARFRGRKNLALTKRGRREAAAVARRIAEAFQPKQIFTSPLGRCIETATVIAKHCGIPARTCDELVDIDYGTWQFKTYKEARTRNATLFAAWFSTPQLVRFPSGESLQDVALRAADVLRMVAGRFPDETVVLVGHDSVNRVLLLELLGLPLSAYWRIAQSPCCFNEIDVVGGEVLIQRINETGHLET